MIVESMELPQVIYEVEEDFPSIQKKLPYISEAYNKERKKKRIKPEDMYPVWYPYSSRRKNKWWICVMKASSVQRYKSIDDASTNMFCYYYSGKEIQLVESQLKTGWRLYNRHVLDRYKERLNLDFQHSLDVAKHLFIFNNSGKNMIEDAAEKKIARHATEGMFLGKMVAEDLFTGAAIIDYRTFISKNEFNPRQWQLWNQATQDIKEKMEAELNNSDWNKDEFQRLADIYSALTNNKK